MINSVVLKDNTYAPSYPGCSFLIDFMGETLAVTCKHSLWVAKTPEMDHVCLQKGIKSWRMHLKNDTTKYLIVDKLLNEDCHERIGEWNTDKDYLVFSVKENYSEVTPLSLLTQPLEKDQRLFSVGWAFRDKEGSQRVYTSFFYKYQDQTILIRDSIFANNAGMSGSPVITRDGYVAAITSTWKQDTETDQWFPSPCSIDYLWEVLFKYWCAKKNVKPTIDSYLIFKTDYEKYDRCSIKPSDNLLVNLFFAPFGTVADFDRWSQEIATKTGIQVQLNDGLKSQLAFNQWKTDYLNGKSDLTKLNVLSEKGNLKTNFIPVCTFGLSLLDDKKIDKALEIMLYAEVKYAGQGQVYAFIGDVYLEMKDFEKARANYNKCLELYPGYPYAIDKLKRMDMESKK